MAVKYQRVDHYPGELSNLIEPIDGAIVCCGIYGVFEHTGIWIGGDIIELKGNGLIRGVSPLRFLGGRSGNSIHVLCDANLRPLIDPHSSVRASARIYEYSAYHVLTNNCHKFVWQCVSGRNGPMTSFFDLNQALSHYFSSRLSWCQIPFSAE